MVNKLPVIEERAYDWGSWSDRTAVQFRDNRLCMFDMGGRPIDENDRKRFEVSRKKAYGGTMSAGAQKRMSRALSHLVSISPQKWKPNPVKPGELILHQLSFLTLTVSSRINIDAKQGYKNLLAPFLDWLRYKGVRHLVWKAELQTRGQLHYHVIFSNTFHWAMIRRKWNRLQCAAGYLDQYAEKNGHADANSTDIKTLKNVKQGSRYIMKELGKAADQQLLKRKAELKKRFEAGEISRDVYDVEINSADAKIEKLNGKVWDCSASLSEKYFCLMLTKNLDKKLLHYMRTQPAAFLIGERFCLIDIDFANPPPWFKCYLPHYKAHMEVIKIGGSKVLSQILN